MGNDLGSAVTDEYDEDLLPDGLLAGTLEGWLIKWVMKVAGWMMRMMG